MKAALLSFIFAIFLLGCAPKVIIKQYNTESTNALKIPIQKVEVLHPDNSFKIKVPPIATIEIKENGISTGCSYEEIVAIAIEKARNLGGNTLLIKEHFIPNVKISCHQIKGEIYFLDNPEDYRSQVEWLKDRPLTINDFRGSVENRPFEAATHSGFTYRYNVIPYEKYVTIEVKAYFDKGFSYFKRSENDVFVLKHEQLHFDIAELYARKFLFKVKSEIKNLSEWTSLQNELYNEIQKEFVLTQDKYDSEVYADTATQQYWENWVDSEMDKFKAYEFNKKLEILRK